MPSGDGVTPLGLQPLCRAGGPLCSPPPAAFKPSGLGSSRPAARLRWRIRHACKRSLGWVFCRLATQDFLFSLLVLAGGRRAVV